MRLIKYWFEGVFRVVCASVLCAILSVFQASVCHGSSTPPTHIHKETRLVDGSTRNIIKQTLRFIVEHPDDNRVSSFYSHASNRGSGLAHFEGTFLSDELMKSSSTLMSAAQFRYKNLLERTLREFVFRESDIYTDKNNTFYLDVRDILRGFGIGNFTEIILGFGRKQPPALEIPRTMYFNCVGSSEGDTGLVVVSPFFLLDTPFLLDTALPEIVRHSSILVAERSIEGKSSLVSLVNQLDCLRIALMPVNIGEVFQTTCRPVNLRLLRACRQILNGV